MKKASQVLALLAVVTFAAPVIGNVIVEGGSLAIESSYPLGQAVGVRAVDPGAAYSNVTNFSGSGAIIDGVTASTGTRVTRMLADDLNFLAASAGNAITVLRFSVGNFNSAAVSVNAGVRFYNDTGGNIPSTFITGFNFNPISFPAGTVSTVTFTIPAANQWPVPANAKMWAGLLFYSSTATTAQLNNFGTGIFNPVDVGSSADQDFLTTANGGSSTGAFAASNPVGSTRAAPYVGLVANHGWEFVAAPEPATLTLLAFGALALIRRRR